MPLENIGVHCYRHINLFYSETHSITVGPVKSFYQEYKTYSRGKCYQFNVSLEVKIIFRTISLQ